MPPETEIKKADMCYSSTTTKRTNLILELTKVRFASAHLPKDHFATAYIRYTVWIITNSVHYENVLCVTLHGNEVTLIFETKSPKSRETKIP